MTDSDVKDAVENALSWEPDVDAERISVSVDAGVVSLRGAVPSQLGKAIAEHAALSPYGSRRVTSELTVDIQMRVAPGYGVTKTGRIVL